ncbi:hypothetical protein, partial [Enterovibrio calviensis]|uniref:hypothetical protein n=1 Tax=Enterovibrio calviensis TaxID=91359 RepID=UPI003735DE4A
MSDLHWVKMPSTWIRNGLLKDNFSSGSNIAEDIAALKIFVVLCHQATSVGEYGAVWLQASETYDSLERWCSLSRASVSKGLKKLILENIIESSGSKKKTYRFKGNAFSGWAKLPKRALVDYRGLVAKNSMARISPHILLTLRVNPLD